MYRVAVVTKSWLFDCTHVHMILRLKLASSQSQARRTCTYTCMLYMYRSIVQSRSVFTTKVFKLTQSFVPFERVESPSYSRHSGLLWFIVLDHNSLENGENDATSYYMYDKD